jgi:hypothetical protein
MDKQYIAIYNYKKYSLDEIMDMIQPYNVRYWHRKQTWESPEEEDIDYKFDVSSEFDKAVQIASVEFKNCDDEFGEYIEFDGMRLRICQEGYSWFDLLQSFGWDTFNTITELEDFQDSDIKVRLKLDSWIDSIAENNAWQVVYNGEARSW